MKRIVLFLATNLAILLALSVVMSIVLPASGVDPSSYAGLLVLRSIWVQGAFISLQCPNGSPSAASEPRRSRPRNGSSTVTKPLLGSATGGYSYAGGGDL